jgi:hypothetical protein
VVGGIQKKNISKKKKSTDPPKSDFSFLFGNQNMWRCCCKETEDLKKENETLNHVLLDVLKADPSNMVNSRTAPDLWVKCPDLPDEVTHCVDEISYAVYHHNFEEDDGKNVYTLVGYLDRNTFQYVPLPVRRR